MDKMETKRAVIVGGGITGLAAAYYLQTQAEAEGYSLEISLIESEERLGGKIITDTAGEYLVEGGPDCFIRQKPWATELAAEVGIKQEVMGTNDERRKVFVLNKGKLTPLPDGVMLIIPTRIMPFLLTRLISWPGKIRMGLDWFIPRFKGMGDESIADFVRRRLGQEALDKIAEPLLSGIHVSDPEKQSLLATFPRFRALEDKHGSLIRGMLAARKHKPPVRKDPDVPETLFLTFKGGMGQFINAVEEKLDSCSVLKNTSVTRMEKENGSYQLSLSNGETLFADAVVLATPSYVASDLLANIDTGLAEQLAQIEYVSTATISMAYKKEDIPPDLDGFGLVIPSKEQRDITACTLTSFKFNHRAPQDGMLLRCFIGGPGREAAVDLSDEEILENVKRELKAIFRINAEPQFTRIYRWRKANPQYNLGHLDRVADLQAYVRENTDHLWITGSAYGGVGIPDCVRQGRETAREVVKNLFGSEDK